MATISIGFRTQLDEAAEPTDEALAIAARTDMEAFAALYRRNVDGIFRYCLRRLGTREAAEDATAQTFERVLRTIVRFRGGSFPAWLYTIARNTTIDVLRRNRFVAPLPERFDPIDVTANPEHEVVARAQAEWVRSLLMILNGDQREVIELRLAGLSNDEIGRVLGKRSGAVRMLSHRAYRHLRTYLDEKGYRHE